MPAGESTCQREREGEKAERGYMHLCESPDTLSRQKKSKSDDSSRAKRKDKAGTFAIWEVAYRHFRP